MRTCLAAVLVLSFANLASSQDLSNKALKRDFDLLSDDDQSLIKSLIPLIEAEGFKALGENWDFFRTNLRFFNTPKIEARLIQWADEGGAQEFVQNMGIKKKRAVRAVKLRFGMLKGLDTLGATQAARSYKKGGLKELGSGERYFVRQRLFLFFPPEEDEKE